LRRLVEVRHGKLDASGRLFSVGKIDFQPAEGSGFPRIAATVTVNAFAYNPVSSSPPIGLPATGTTTATTTPSSGAAASGAAS
jgi:hypothetical protein